MLERDLDQFFFCDVRGIGIRHDPPAGVASCFGARCDRTRACQMSSDEKRGESLGEIRGNLGEPKRVYS
jgi:hypothetical protein